MQESRIKGVESVKERLLRLQKKNYRSIPVRDEPEVKEEKVNVDSEIEELKQSSMIKAMPIDRTAPKDDDGFVDLATFKPKVEEELPVPRPSEFDEDEFMEPAADFNPGPSVVGNMLKDNNKHLDRVKVALQKVEEIKKKMVKSDNFLGLYYDLNKAEKELVEVMDEVNATGVEVPAAMESRIKSAVSRKMRA